MRPIDDAMAVVYPRGSRISEMMLKYVGVAPYENMTALTAPMAAAKGGLATTWMSLSHGPLGGAAAGRSCTPTAMVSVKTDAMRNARPTQPNHVILFSVRKEPMKHPAMAATATKMAVQAPWTEMALSATEMDTMAEEMIMMRSGCVSSGQATTSLAGLGRQDCPRPGTCFTH